LEIVPNWWDVAIILDTAKSFELCELERAKMRESSVVVHDVPSSGAPGKLIPLVRSTARTVTLTWAIRMTSSEAGVEVETGWVVEAVRGVLGPGPVLC
jgi:hypothetical protein